MMNKILSVVTIVRHAVAITLVMSAAGAMVASSVDVSAKSHTAPATTTSTSTVESAVATKSFTMSEVEQVASANDQADRATEHSTKTERKTEPKTVDPQTPGPKAERKTVEPKPADTAKPAEEPKHDGATAAKPSDETLSVLVKDCVTKYAGLKANSEGATEASAACRKAIEATGLTSSVFWARFGPKTEPTVKPEPSKKPEPTRRPETPKPATTLTTAQIEALVKDCFDKYLIVRSTKEGGSAAVEACTRAMSASGLTGDAFWAKFGRPGTN